MRRALVAALLLAATACYPRASVPDSERQKSRELEGQRRFAKVALYVGPFFGDGTRLLASDQPFDELDLLETGGGEPIRPQRAERVLAPGTPLRVEKVEFPTGWIIARRVVMTPRYHPWVFLSLEGEPRPLVLVLPQTLSSAEDVRVELGRYLGGPESLAAYQALPEPQRAAVQRKGLLEGMSAQAVEMAWGYPEKKVVDRPARTEAWSWPGDRRKAFLQDDKLVRWEPLR
ncbi:MAG TPA: hypothetical protein VF805_01545 [Anaeromyxobacteraceae bacterium]